MKVRAALPFAAIREPLLRAEAYHAHCCLLIFFVVLPCDVCVALLVVAKVNGTAEEESVAAIESYDAKKKVAFRQYQEALDRSELTPDVLHKLKLDLAELSDTLMDIEMLLVEQMAAILEEFEKSRLGVHCALLFLVRMACPS